MKPYLESGRAAERQLETQPGAAPDAVERRLLSNLKAFKQVINVLGVFGIVLIPLIGVMMHSAFIAAVVALNFLAVIVLLELMERRVKRDLHNHREAANPEAAL
ncbi:MAG: hypothetical protein KDB82_05685 [Planctomycetes bacterium]|nr:hypothetical protein [Planctomycetota bacterium]